MSTARFRSTDSVRPQWWVVAPRLGAPAAAVTNDSPNPSEQADDRAALPSPRGGQSFARLDGIRVLDLTEGIAGPTRR
jgi:hypothetical protein